MITFAVEKLATIIKGDWARSNELLKAHWDEVASNKHIFRLNVDLPRYLELERQGRLHLVIMREFGDIVGYSVHLIADAHPHYRDVMVAEDDVHYIVPRLRGTGLHDEMRKIALQGLWEANVKFVTARTRIGHEHDTSLRRLGYEPVNMVYGLDLERWHKSQDPEMKAAE